MRVALLHHHLPDGSSHVDVLIARDDVPRGDDMRDVPTWRCAERPDEAAPGRALALERIGDHRAIYLRLEMARDLGEGRGWVRPLRAGEATALGDDLFIRWEDGGSSRWRIEAGAGLGSADQRVQILFSEERKSESPGS
jgi:hypothetical protein